jgi:hypothetical protein
MATNCEFEQCCIQQECFILKECWVILMDNTMHLVLNMSYYKNNLYNLEHQLKFVDGEKYKEFWHNYMSDLDF